jgi:hypothetical protein
MSRVRRTVQFEWPVLLERALQLQRCLQQVVVKLKGLTYEIIH